MDKILSECIKGAIKINEEIKDNQKGVRVVINPDIKCVSFSQTDENDNIIWDYDFYFDGNPLYTTKDFNIFDMLYKLLKICVDYGIEGDKNGK